MTQQANGMRCLNHPECRNAILDNMVHEVWTAASGVSSQTSQGYLSCLLGAIWMLWWWKCCIEAFTPFCRRKGYRLSLTWYCRRMERKPKVIIMRTSQLPYSWMMLIFATISLLGDLRWTDWVPQGHFLNLWYPWSHSIGICWKKKKKLPRVYRGSYSSGKVWWSLSSSQEAASDGRHI